LSKRADELKTPEAKQLASDSKLAFESSQSTFQAAQAITQAAQQRSASAAGAKKAVEDAQKRLESAGCWRKRLASESPLSSNKANRRLPAIPLHPAIE